MRIEDYISKIIVTIAISSLVLMKAYAISGYTLNKSYSAGDTVTATNLTANFDSGRVWSVKMSDTINKFVRYTNAKDSSVKYLFIDTLNTRSGGIVCTSGVFRVDSIVPKDSIGMARKVRIDSLVITKSFNVLGSSELSAAFGYRLNLPLPAPRTAWYVLDSTKGFDQGVSVEQKGFYGGCSFGNNIVLCPNNDSLAYIVTPFNETNAGYVWQSSVAIRKGYAGCFTDGSEYVYFVPYNNGAAIGRFKRAKITGVYQPTFGTVDSINLTSTDADLKGFVGGCSYGGFAYLAPFDNGAKFGKVAKINLDNFSTVSVLNLVSTDADLKGFSGCFTCGTYVYFVPRNNGSTFGKVARVLISDFSTVQVLNVATVNANAKGFIGGFCDSKYGYLVPDNNGLVHGNFVRFSLSDFTTASVSVLDLTATNASLKGFAGGFTDGRYAYLAPNNNGAAHGLVPRIDLTNFSTVDVITLTNTKAYLKGFLGAFTDGNGNGFFVPNNNGAVFGAVPAIRVTPGCAPNGSP
jgi:hypothetical protein